jgi:hypothetical protein
VISAWLAIRIEEPRSATARRRLRDRTLLVDPARTFHQLAEALNLAIRRWDASGSHEFVLADGRRIGPPGDLEIGDEAVIAVGSVLAEGDTFLFRPVGAADRFCRVVAANVDPDEQPP